MDFDGNEEKDVDAIMITYYESTSHTSLLVQNENGDWYFFFWGPENSNPYPAALPCGTEAKPTFEKIINKDIIDEESGTVNLDLLNSYLEESEIYTGYKFDSYVYYDGDYSKTYRYLNDYVEKDELDDYNLYFNNCSDVSVRALLLGEGMSVFERFMLLMYCSGVLTIPRIVDIIARFTHDNTQCFS